MSDTSFYKAQGTTPPTVTTAVEGDNLVVTEGKTPAGQKVIQRSADIQMGTMAQHTKSIVQMHNTAHRPNVQTHSQTTQSSACNEPSMPPARRDVVASLGMSLPFLTRASSGLQQIPKKPEETARIINMSENENVNSIANTLTAAKKQIEDGAPGKLKRFAHCFGFYKNTFAAQKKAEDLLAIIDQNVSELKAAIAYNNTRGGNLEARINVIQTQLNSLVGAYNIPNAEAKKNAVDSCSKTGGGVKLFHNNPEVASRLFKNVNTSQSSTLPPLPPRSSANEPWVVNLPGSKPQMPNTPNLSTPLPLPSSVAAPHPPPIPPLPPK